VIEIREGALVKGWTSGELSQTAAQGEEKEQGERSFHSSLLSERAAGWHFEINEYQNAAIEDLLRRSAFSPKQNQRRER